MALPVTGPSVPLRVRPPRAASVRARRLEWLGMAELVIQSACYSGDYFDDLADPSGTLVMLDIEPPI